MSESTIESPTISLTREEHALLLSCLEQLLHEKQIEEHRTKAFEFRKHIQQQEDLLRGLIEKLRKN